MIGRDRALELVKEHVSNANLVKHMLAVSAIMKGVAQRFDEDVNLWEVVGLLHDIDYEKVHDDFDRHGLVSAEMVSGLLPEEGLHAIKAHNRKTGVEAKSRLDIALHAADALSGLIIATALMMPDKKLVQVKVRSLKRKFKDKSFARGVSRENVLLCGEIGLELEDFLTIGLESSQAIGEKLGL